ncbi:hypothetical protein [Pontimicrobium sp. MEBiC06410]
MKRFSLLLAIVSIPFFIVILINETRETPSNSINREYCTRACHNKGCIHFNELLKNDNQSSFATRHFDIYKKNIAWLKQNPFKFSYAQMNLLLYVIIFPIVSIFLLWRLTKRLPKSKS